MYACVMCAILVPVIVLVRPPRRYFFKKSECAAVPTRASIVKAPGMDRGLYIGIADGMSIARVWAFLYSK